MLFIMDHLTVPLDYALVIHLIRINRPLFPVDSILPFLLTPFSALSFLLAAPGFDCSEPGVEVLILLPEVLVLLPEEFHGFCHRL
jgi:hypothetical protein